jgi:hypothetical protein
MDAAPGIRKDPSDRILFITRKVHTGTGEANMNSKWIGQLMNNISV